MSRDRSSRWTKRFKTLVALVLSLQLLTFSGGLVSAASAQEVPPSQTDSPTPPPSPDPSPSPSPSPSATATLLLTTVPGLTAAQQADLVSLHGATLESSIPVLRMLFVSVPADSVQSYVDSFASDLAVESVDTDRTREAEATPSDPSYGDQWALPKIGWDQAYGSVTPNGSSTIAVLDTGVDASVADLSGRILSGYSAFGTDPATDPNGHGTWLASIAAAETDNGSGIAGVDFANVNVMPVQVLDASGTGQDGDIIAGVVYAVDHGADVILMGFSNPGRSDALQAAVDYAWSHGAVLVAAAGNDGSTSPTFPAGLEKVVGVAATDQSDSLWFGSNSSQAAFISAPGVDISADDASGVVSITGTSASAAIVAGTAALLRANAPGAGPGVIVGRLARNTDAGGAGNGRLNLVRSLSDSSTDPVVPTGAPGGGPVVGPYHAATNGTITGTVTDSSTGLPISGATVSCAITPAGCNNIASTTTAANGTYSLAIQYGGSTATASVTASASGHTSVTANVSVASNAGARNFSLAASNAAPSAVNKTPSTNEDVAVGITLTGSDAQQCELVFSIVSPPANGTLGSISNNACVPGSTNTDSASVTYSPNANYNGSDSFTYKVNDGTLDSASASVSITVNSVNDAPSFTKGADQIVNEDAGTQSVSNWATAISKGPANESGQTVDFIVTNDNNSLFSSQPTVSATGTLTYTSAANANGSATVTVKIHDDGGTANGGVNESPTHTFTITVNSVNDAPSFTKGADQIVNEDAGTQSGSNWATAISKGPANELGQTVDFIVTNDNNSLFSSQPTVSATGTLTYTSAANANGSATVTVKIHDDGGTTNGGFDTSAAQTFTITVTGVNDVPLAAGQLVTTNEDTAKIVTLSATDVETCELTFSIVTGPTHGSLGTITGNDCVAGSPNVDTASITYTPAADYHGSDSFTFKVNDGTVDSNTPTISITVTSVNDTPTADAQAVSATEDIAKTISLTGSDADGDALTFSIVAGPSHGTLGLIGTVGCSGVPSSCSANVTYAPDANYNGSDSFSFRVNDGTVYSSAATVSITVAAVNDLPSADAKTATTDEDAPKTVTLTGSDTEGSALTFSIVSGPSHGTLGSIGTVTCSGIPSSCSADVIYTPAADYNGSDSFTYKVNDGADDSNTATVSITVNAVNDAPVCQDVSITTAEDTAGETSPNCSDVDSGTLTYTVTDATRGTSGFAANKITYSPNANYNGPDSFTYTANDGTLDSNAADVDATVNAVNDAPVCQDVSITTAEDTAGETSPNCSDVDSATLTYTVTGATHGTSGFAANKITYSPNANYNGPDSFTYTANDGTLDSNAAEVDVTVNAINDAPSFTEGADETVNEDAGAQTVNGWATNISAGPSNESSQTVDFIVTNDNNTLFSNQPGVSATGTLTYTPAANANGSTTVTVQIHDDGGTANGGVDTSAAQTFTISVTPVNDAPSFTKGADETVNEDAGAQTVNGWATNISAGPSNESSQTVDFIVTNDNNSLFSTQPGVSATGTLTYTPAANANGSAAVTVQIHDDGGTANGGVDTSAAQTLTISVSAVNDAPVAVDDANSTNEDTAVATDVISNDTDVDNTNAQLSVKPGSLSATNGSATLDADGRTIHFTPDLNRNDGNVNAAGFTVTYKAIDGTDDSNTATLTISVSAVNDAPVAVDDANSTNEDTAVATDVISNDTDVENTNAQLSVKPGSLSATNGSATLDADGRTIHFTPDLNRNDGNVNAAGFTVTYKAIDGTDDSNTATLTISVSAVNDAPGFDKGADQTVDEDTGAQTVPGWATNISAGPSDESSQTVTFIVTSTTNSGLFAGPGQPAVSSNGALTYTPATDANGTAIITVKAHDSGGAANGGVNESATQNFMITVNAVNDAPSFTKGANQTVNEDAGAQSVSGWATAISAGPANESSQTVDFIVTNNNSALFSAQPAVSASGTLTYTSAANANGSATVTVKIHDDGGTANGGVDTSAGQTITINVTAVNDPPSFTKGADQTVAEDSGPHSVPNWATNIFPGPSDESGQIVDFIVTNNNNGLFSTQPMISATGTLTYTSATNANGTATVTVKIHDNGGTANGGMNESAAQTFTITVTPVNDAPVITSATFGVTNVPCPATSGGTNATLTVTFTDADSGDTHSATIDWDNNPATTGDNQNVGPVTSPFSRSHSYPAGMYTAKVTVTDAAGLSDSKTASIKVNYNASGILQPVNDTQAHNDPSIFKFGSTIPVKVQFFNCDGTIASSTLNVKIEVMKTSGSTPNSGVDEAITNTNSPDSGSYMRWSGGVYLYNLNTKSLSDSSASYHITITVESTGQTVETDFGTKAK